MYLNQAFTFYWILQTLMKNFHVSRYPINLLFTSVWNYSMIYDIMSDGMNRIDASIDLTGKTNYTVISVFENIR